MLSTAVKIAGIGLAVYLAVVAATFVAQRRLMYFPAGPLPPPPPGWQAVRLDSADGLALTAWYASARSGKPTLAYFHGNAGGIDNRVAKVARFVAAGYGVLLVEYRGYGGNPGSPSESGLLADGRAALAFLRERGVGPQAIVLLGESLGTGVAVALAAENPVAGLILESPFTSAADAGQLAYPWLPVRWLIRDRFDSAARIGQVHAPLLVVHGEQDAVVPARLGARLYALANAPKRLVELPHAHHTDMTAFGLVDIELAFLAHLTDDNG